MADENNNIPSDPLNESAPLEVAQMPESDELQERRSLMRGQIEEVGGFEETGAAAFEGSGGGFLDLLEEANLGPQHLRFCLGAVFIVFILLGLIVLIVFGVRAFSSGVDISLPNPSKDKPPVLDEIPFVDEPDPIYEIEPSLNSTLQLGDANTTIDAGVQSGSLLGTQGAETVYQAHVLEFETLWELYKTDVNAMLDQSENRAQRFDLHLEDFEIALLEVQERQLELSTAVLAFRGELERLETEKAARETEFFDHLNALDAKASEDSLSDFKGLSALSSSVRADLSAYEKLLSLYEELIPFAQARLLDLQLNEQALVQGIKIYDVPDSDLNLILDERL